MYKSLSEHPFQFTFINRFPGDSSYNNYPRPTPEVLFSLVNPTATQVPKIVASSEELSAELGIAFPLNTADTKLLSGNHVKEGETPYAYRYGGHQFGQWAGQLGDGRAINLGEWITPQGERWELQLKGAGETPYSRRADGRAVLRSSVREYLMSEAMYHLGVSTTRALSLCTTGDDVVRDMFYDGNAKPEPGAVVCRTAPSFLRFGNFEILNWCKEYDLLKELATYTIDEHFPSLDSTKPGVFVACFEEIVERTLDMIVDWMRVGFTHGVMNTDNMSILGLTIDYGPYSMVDHYDLSFTPNTTDLPGRRYAFGRQPSIACWNLEKLSEALEPVLSEGESFKEVLESMGDRFNAKYMSMLENKLGLSHNGSESNKSLLQDLLGLLQRGGFDYTLFYRELIALRKQPYESTILEGFTVLMSPESEHPHNALFEQLRTFITAYKEYVGEAEWGSSRSVGVMEANNPAFILRNCDLHEAIQQLELGDETLFRELEKNMKTPYLQPSEVRYQRPAPDWALDTPGCALLSCSS
ncbi:MAG: YdiU family protein [Fibrobacterales bacterium]